MLKNIFLFIVSLIMSVSVLAFGKPNVCKLKFGSIQTYLRQDCLEGAASPAECLLVDPKTKDTFSDTNCSLISSTYDRICVVERRCGNGNVIIDGYKEKRADATKFKSAPVEKDDEGVPIDPDEPVG